MSDFINTIDSLGEDETIKRIIERSIEEFSDNVLAEVGRHAFNSCTALKEVNLPSVLYLGASAFFGCSSLETVNMPELLGTKPNMYDNQWFGLCTSLKKVIFPKLQETAFSMMFNQCKNLEYVDLPVVSWLGSNTVVGCTSLKALILRRTEGVATLNSDIGGGSIKNGTGYVYVPKALIEEYKVATNWTVVATQFRAIEDYTLSGTLAGSIVTEDATEISDDVVTKIPGSRCAGYTALVSVDLPAVTTLGANVFDGCTSLANVNLPNLESAGGYTFRNCAFTEINDTMFPKLTVLAFGLFIGNDITRVDFSKLVQIEGYNFANNTVFKEVILRNTDAICTLVNTNAFGFNTGPMFDGTAYIYVPRALVEQYKVATNWSTFANQFRALEDYTVDGTIHGELDESKI